MKKFLISLILLLFLIVPCEATISRVGTSTGTNTCTFTTHAIGDILIVAAFRATTGTTALGSGFQSIITKTGTTSSMRVGFKIATATNDAAGTWTNATATVCHVYRSSSYGTGSSLYIGASASAAQTTNTINFPALTMTHADTTSWVLGFVGVNNLTNTIAANPPSGMTNESSETSATDQCAGHDTNGAVSGWSSTNATTTGTPGGSVSVTVELIENQVGASITNIIQHVMYAGNSQAAASSDAGNNFIYNLPNPTLSGDVLILAVSYPISNTPSITDNKSNTWPASGATGTKTVTGGTMAIQVFVLTSVTTGTQTITVGFGSVAIIPVHVWITEVTGITALANGVTAATVNTNGIISAGSFTPTANNSNGGNLVLAYMGEDAVTGTTNPALIVPETNFSLNDADISWTQAQGWPKASEFYLQATSAAINPRFYLNTGGTDTYNIVAVALALGSQGSSKPAGIHIDRMLYFGDSTNPSAALLEIPATGNLAVIIGPESTVATPVINTVKDSDAISWTQRNTTAGQPSPWDRVNSTANPARTLTVNFATTGSSYQLVYYDISGAATSPFDVVAGVGTTSTNNVNSIASQPSITPSQANELIIGCLQVGDGPATGITVPSGAIFDIPTFSVANFSATIATTILTASAPNWGTIQNQNQVVSGAGISAGTIITTTAGTGTGGAGTYNINPSNTVSVAETMNTSMDDSNTVGWGNGLFHWYNGATTSAQSVTWSIANNPSNSVSSVAVAYKAAPIAAGGTPQRTLIGVGQ